MKFFIIFGIALVASSLANGFALKGSNARISVQSQETLSSSNLDVQQEEQPTPYQFSYDTHSEGSQSTRSESGDATGKVIGQYAIKGADGISRIVSYTADSEGFRANITTNEPGTESQNPSFIVLHSSQLPAAEISRNLQTEADLAQQEEQPLEEAVELPQPQPAKSVSAPPRKSSGPAKSAARRPAQQAAPRQSSQSAQVSVPVKSRRPAQQQSQQISNPSKRPAAASPSKGQAIRSRGPSKSVAAPTTTTTQRPRQVQAAQPSKRIQLQPAPQLQEEQSEDAQLTLAADQTEESAEDDSQESF